MQLPEFIHESLQQMWAAAGDGQTGSFVITSGQAPLS